MKKNIKKKVIYIINDVIGKVDIDKKNGMR